MRLRDAVGIVAAFFGPDWARVFCGVEPPATPVGQASGFGLLEGPVAALGLEGIAAHAEQLRETQPRVAAEMQRAIADELQAGGYPGHAQVFRHRAAEFLRDAGDTAGAFDLFWQLGYERFVRGATDAHLRELDDDRLAPDGLRQAKLTVLRSASRWYGTGIDLPATVPALRTVLEADDQLATALTTIVVEQALVDGLYATDPPEPIVGPQEPAANLAELTVALLEVGSRALASPTAG